MKHLKIFLFIVLTMSMVNVYGQENKEKKDMLGRSPADSVRIDRFNNNHVDLTGQELADASFPKSWPLFGTKARMSIGGYLKVDYLQDFNGIHNDRYELVTANVHVDNSGVVKEQGYMNLFARESRFNIDFRTTTENGKPLRVYVEMDFWNLDRDPFHNAPRLRHFYAVYNHWLVGRSWGILTDVYSIPFIIDFETGDTFVGSRRPQIRYETPLSDKVNGAVGVEMLEFPFIDGNGFDGEASMLLPALAARTTLQTDAKSRMMVGGSVYQLRWDGLETGPNATALGWGLVFSGGQSLTDKFSMLWNTSIGNGWGSNIIALYIDGSSSVLTPEEKLETKLAWNFQLGFAYRFSSILVMNLSGGWVNLDASEYDGDNDFHAGGTGHLNLIYSPVKAVNVGI